jgi:hypothetical protein
MSDSRVFHECLPPHCPPNGATDASYPSAIRLVDASSVDQLVETEFSSFAALGENRRGCDPCDLASCSLFESERCESFRNAVRLPRLRSKKIAEISIPLGSGLSTRNSSGHIHFWRFASFDPISSVKEVRDHGYA